MSLPTDTIASGSIFIGNRTPLPEPLRLEIDSTGRGWARLASTAPDGHHLDGHELGKTLVAAGWTCYFVAGTIHATAFGTETPGTIQTALKRLLKTVELQDCNCVEIDSVVAHSNWGVPCVSVSGHSRNIQQDAAAGYGRQGSAG